MCNLSVSAPKIGKSARSRSVMSEAPLLPQKANAAQRPSQAYLIKQRGSRDSETAMVMWTPVGQSPNPNVPTIVGPKRGLKGSLNSLDMKESGMNCEFQVSQEALEAQRLEKLVRNLRRQANVTQNENSEDARWCFNHVRDE